MQQSFKVCLLKEGIVCAKEEYNSAQMKNDSTQDWSDLKDAVIQAASEV